MRRTLSRVLTALAMSLTGLTVVLATTSTPAQAAAPRIAVFGNNQIDDVLTSAGMNVTLVTDAQLATAGFVDGFDAVVFTRTGVSFNPVLSAGAATNLRSYVERAVALNGDFADVVPSDLELTELVVNAVTWAAATGHGYVGELFGATAALTSNSDGEPALNFVKGSASTTTSGPASAIDATAAGAGHPILDGVSLPRTADDLNFSAPMTGVDDSAVLARYANGRPAVLAFDRPRVAVLGNNQVDDTLNAAQMRAILVTDAQLATVGFLSGFDAVVFTRTGVSFNPILSAGAAANLRAYSRREVALNGDFADNVANDPAVTRLWVNAVRWAAASGHGYVGELLGATAALAANGDGEPALNLVPGTAASSAGGPPLTLSATAAGAGHPVLEGVAFPLSPSDLNFSAAITGADPSDVLARFSNGNPAVLANGIDTAPAAPTDVSVTLIGGTTARVAFTPPTNDGGSHITGYTAVCASPNGGATQQAGGAGSPIDVAALTSGATYTCRVRATNAVGDGPLSDPSAPFTPVTLTAPSQPRNVKGIPTAPDKAKVKFAAPTSDGGLPITSYLAQCTSSNGGASGSASGLKLALVVKHLTPAATYTCQVRASNDVGPGPFSAPSAPFTMPAS